MHRLVYRLQNNMFNQMLIADLHGLTLYLMITVCITKCEFFQANF